MVVLISYLEKIQGEVFENRRLIDNVEMSNENVTISKNTNYSGQPILGQLLSFIQLTSVPLKSARFK